MSRSSSNSVVDDKEVISSKNSIPSKESSGWDTIGRLSTLKKNLKTLSAHTSKKPVDDNKDKHEPSRFLGEGVSYKAKLIGILEVSEPRGDRMCQDALQDLKIAIRAAGEHKQRITVHIAIEGLRLRDEKSGDCLYHHPVHKISFIAQDMTDSRAFGYIFGSPDTGHKFFGIKTDKAASQVVMSMRDLFQVVFELKKKEIEMAKQHLEQQQMKYGMGVFGDSLSNKSPADSPAVPSKLRPTSDDKDKDNASKPSEAIADLLDLEFELNNIQQGLSQMERITPSDPFGDSFAPAAATSTRLAPPPKVTEASSTPSPVPPTQPPQSKPKSTPTPAPVRDKDQHWFDRETEALFDDNEVPTSPPSQAPIAPAQSTKSVARDEGDVPENSIGAASLTKDFDVFTELDPLGTGRSKPYIDKKDFFQELKNPPKKILKDLVGDLPNESYSHLFQADFDDKAEIEVKRTKEPIMTSSIDPFGDDPFDKADPFVDREHSAGFSVVTSMTSDPFDTCFADFTNFSEQSDLSATSSQEIPIRNSPQPSEGSPSVHGPLRVSLPPEKHSEMRDVSSPKLSPSPPSSRSRNKYSRLHKQNTLSGLVKLPSPKQKTRSRMSKQNTLESSFERSSPIMDGITLKNKGMGSPSPPNVSFQGDLAPEPPPRPAATSTLIKPPPLPPKRQLQSTVLKPPPRPPHSDDHPHYDYIENCESAREVPLDIKSPPIPVPARRPRFGGDTETAAPNRPLKTNLPPQTESEYYLTPFPLLPPPQKKGLSPKNSTSKDPVVSPRPVPTKTVSSLDITLSQLSKTGFSDLAATLNMSPTMLSKMTLQELTKCLQNLSETQKSNPSVDEFIEDGGKLRKNVLKSEQYSALRESLDEDTPPFKAEFESNFDLNVEPKVIQTKEDESLFDKYAVFRELLEQEKTIFDNVSFTSHNFDDSKATESLNDEPLEYEEQEENESTFLPANDEEEIKEVKFSEPLTKPSIDRYAALRDICLDDFADSKDTEKDDTEPLSDKEDDTRCEDELDTLTLSRPHSESTDSPTATIRETQSIMESTIMEEDANALDEEDGPDEGLVDVGMTLPTVAESNESIAASESPIEAVPLKDPSISSLQSLKGDGFCSSKEMEFSSLVDGWAKFDNGVAEVEKPESNHSEGNVSPWSIDSKDTKGPYSPAWKDPAEKKSRKGRRHKAPSNNWQEEDESEEGWDGRYGRRPSWNEPPWRENGWSDGDSMYEDDHHPYEYKQHPQHHNQRRGRRRKVSPWRKSSRDPSPWEDDDRDLSEDQWDSKRWDESSWQTRPKHRGHSWEDERRREDSRRDDPRWDNSRRDDKRDDLRRDDPRRDSSRRDDTREDLRRDDPRRDSSRRDDPREELRRDDSRWDSSRREDSREDLRRDDPRRDSSRRDESRKRRQSPWSTEGERKSSRESLTWEDDERYSRRNQRERRRKRWEDCNYSRRDWRDREQDRRNCPYYRDRSHESPWEDEFSEQGDEDSPRCQSRKQMWGRSRNSEDEQYDRRYMRPSSREEQPMPQSEAHWARKSQTLQTRSKSSRSKKRSQNSPFEDDFSSQSMFGSEKSPGAGSDISDHGYKNVQTKPQSSPDDVLKKKDVFSDIADFSPQESKLLTPKSRQSPFEDDFTPPETKRTNGRSISSDVIEKRTHFTEQKISDDVFLADSENSEIRSHNSKFDKTVLDRSITNRRNKINNIDQNTGKLKSESEILNEELARKRSTGKKQGLELKSRVSNLRKNESSSIVKSDSINIFARSGDPFDDDFFSGDSTSSTLTRNKESNTKTKDPFKWTEAFSAFNFDEEAK